MMEVKQQKIHRGVGTILSLNIKIKAKRNLEK